MAGAPIVRSRGTIKEVNNEDEYDNEEDSDSSLSEKSD